MMAMQENFCRNCGQKKSVECFQPDSRYSDGYQHQCRLCRNEKNRELYWRKRPEGRKRNSFGRPLSPGEWEEVIAKGKLRCRMCGEEKPLSEYRRHRTRIKLYYYRDCRDCLREREAKQRAPKREKLARQRHLRRCEKYGITEQQYREMQDKQNGRCAICGKPLTKAQQVIDHDHISGKVRGIVHSHCNLVLGNSREDASVLLGAVRYLRKHHGSDRQRFRCLDNKGQTVYLEIVA